MKTFDFLSFQDLLVVFVFGNDINLGANIPPSIQRVASLDCGKKLECPTDSGRTGTLSTSGSDPGETMGIIILLFIGQ